VALVDLIQQKKTIPGDAPLQDMPTGFFEVVASSFESSRDNHITDSRERLMFKQQQERQNLYKDITGSELTPQMASNYKPFVEPRGVGILSGGLDPTNIELLRQRHNDRFIEQAVNELKRHEPERFKELKTHEEMMQAAKQKAISSGRKFDSIANRSGSLSRVVGSLVGGIGAQFTDFINVATLPFGASAGRSILKAALIEAGINAGVESVTQPNIAKWQKEIGNQYGFKDAMMNIGLAAVMGGGFTTVARGIKPTASFMFRHAADSKLLPGPARRAAAYMSRAAHIEEATPFIANPKADSGRHIKSVTRTVEAFNERRAVRTDELPISEKEFQAIDTTPKRGLSDIQKTQLEEIKRFQTKLDEIEKTEGQQALRLFAEQKTPKKTVGDLPQQLLKKADDLEKGEKLLAKSLAQEELEMLKEAGIEPDKNGVIPKKRLQTEFKQRAERGDIDTTLEKTNTDHIEEHRLLQKQDESTPVATQNRAREATDESLEPVAAERNLQLVNEKVQRIAEQEEVLRRAASSESFEAEFERLRSLADTDPNLKVTLEDGQTTLKNILDEIEADEVLQREMRQCALG